MYLYMDGQVIYMEAKKTNQCVQQHVDANLDVDFGHAQT